MIRLKVPATRSKTSLSKKTILGPTPLRAALALADSTA